MTDIRQRAVNDKATNETVPLVASLTATREVSPSSIPTWIVPTIISGLLFGVGLERSG
jgi:hypothetical protein